MIMTAVAITAIIVFGILGLFYIAAKYGQH